MNRNDGLAKSDEAGFLASRQLPRSLTAKSPQSLHNLGTQPPRDTPPDPRSHKSVATLSISRHPSPPVHPPRGKPCAKRRLGSAQPGPPAYRKPRSCLVQRAGCSRATARPPAIFPSSESTYPPRCVRSAAAAAEAAVIPSTMSPNIPDSFNAANSSPARPKIPGSPALSRTTGRPFCASATTTR